MPRSWSNRKIEHIDLDASRRGFPLVGWILFGLGGLALCVYTAIAIAAVTHPIQIEVTNGSQISMPAKP
jgi:hypothetical protein